MNIKKIQELTGYSYSTISRVINGKSNEFRISERTTNKILEIARLINYRPNMLARGLRLKKSMTVGLIVSDIRNPFFGEYASRVEHLLQEQGYSMILCNSGEVPDNETLYLRILHDRQVDGILIAPVHKDAWPELNSLGPERALVLVDRVFRETELFWVTSENMRAAEAVTDELIDLGRTRIAFLGGAPDTYISEERYKGYQKSHWRHSLDIDEQLVSFGGYSAEDGERMLEEIVAGRNDVDAVFCVNNLVFFGAMNIVAKLEAAGHERLVMAAFDVGRNGKLFRHPLICANQDLEKLAECSVSLLLDKINRRPVAEHQVILPVSIDTYGLSEDLGPPENHESGGSIP